ncbi:MAG: EMC3/TMCO1 family protein [archaeon]
MLDSFFNSIFGSLIKISPALALVIICFLLTLITTLAYKFLTDQKMLKKHKEEMKDMQKEINSLKDNPKKMMEKQKELMEKNFKVMIHSMKPLLFTLIPLFIIISWLSATFAYAPLSPDQQFSIKVTFDESLNGEKAILSSPELIIRNPEQTIQEQEVIWYVKGNSGSYDIKINYTDKEYTKNILITDEWKPLKIDILKNSDIEKVEFGDKFKPLFGLTWIWIYLILSIIFSIALRKLLKVY